MGTALEDCGCVNRRRVVDDAIHQPIPWPTYSRPAPPQEKEPVAPRQGLIRVSSLRSPPFDTTSGSLIGCKRLLFSTGSRRLLCGHEVGKGESVARFDTREACRGPPSQW